MSTPKKKPSCKANPAKKPARQTKFQAHGEIVWEKRARPIPPPPPGWEIVGKDDPRLDCLPRHPMCLAQGGWWILDPVSRVGGSIEPHSRALFTFALPIATQSATPQASPPMIRLRLPSEKPTREDADNDENIFVLFKGASGTTLASTYRWDIKFDGDELAWFSLPEGLLPREPTQEEKWQAEFEECFPDFDLTKQENGEYLRAHAATAWRGFLAAKKGGAE